MNATRISTHKVESNERVSPQRVLGRYSGSKPGPLVVVVGGIHGNEPSGIEAAARVLSTLQEHELPLAGDFVALAGNLAALESGRRYVDFDLNRMWSEEQLGKLRAGIPQPDAASEVEEQRELLDVLSDLARERVGQEEGLIVLDLHSSSAAGAPFSCIDDTLHSRRLALALPIPLILGVEELVHGSLLEFVSDRGHVCVAVEGGQHDDPETIDHHEAAIWISLVSSGALQEHDVPDLAGFFTRLKDSGRGHPGVIEVDQRHAISAEDQFRMKPGYNNFQAVAEGQVLGWDKDGEVCAPGDCLVVLPLYQAQGDDGFFLGHEVRRFWLRLSAVIRRLRLDRLMRLLPGVRAHRKREETLVVNSGIARFLHRELFHLSGYRKAATDGQRKVYVRRRPSGRPGPLD